MYVCVLSNRVYTAPHAGMERTLVCAALKLEAVCLPLSPSEMMKGIS